MISQPRRQKWAQPKNLGANDHSTARWQRDLCFLFSTKPSSSWRKSWIDNSISRALRRFAEKLLRPLFHWQQAHDALFDLDDARSSAG